MKRLVIAVVALALAPVAFAQLYKYTDKDGKTVYTDQPPASTDSKQLKIQTAPPAAAAPAPAKSALEKDKELEKGRKDGREAAKKADDTAQRAREAEEKCATAKANYEQWKIGERLTKRSETGERIYIEADEQEREKEKARVIMDQACKKA
jgi:hypothetical protein